MNILVAPELVNRLIKEIRRKLDTYRTIVWNDILGNLTDHNRALGKFKSETSKFPKNIPPIQGFAGLVYDDLGKVEAFAESLETQFRTNKIPNSDKFVKTEVRNYHTWNANIHSELRQATEREATKIITYLKA